MQYLQEMSTGANRLRVNYSIHRLGITTRLAQEITRVNLWHVVSCRNLACNSVHEVNLRVKVNLWLANP